MVPILFDKNYTQKDSYVVYTLEKNYKSIESYEIVDINNYININLNIKSRSTFPLSEINRSFSCAIGFMCYSNYSKILPLDYDSICYSLINMEFRKIISKDQVIAADLVCSSRGSYHIIAGLKDYLNIDDYIQYKSPNICNGYQGVGKKHGMYLIRISQKFNRKGEKDLPIYLRSIRKDIYTGEIIDSVDLENRYNPDSHAINRTKEKRKPLILRN